MVDVEPKRRLDRFHHRAAVAAQRMNEDAIIYTQETVNAKAELSVGTEEPSFPCGSQKSRGGGSGKPKRG